MDPRGHAGSANAPSAGPLDLPQAPPTADATGKAPWASTSTDRPPRLPLPQPPPWQSSASPARPPWRAPSSNEPIDADDGDPYDAYAPLAADIEAVRIPIRPDWPTGASVHGHPISHADPLNWPPVPTDFRPGATPPSPAGAEQDPLARSPLSDERSPAGATTAPDPDAQLTAWDPGTWRPATRAGVLGEPLAQDGYADSERVFEPARVSEPYDEVSELPFTDSRPGLAADVPRQVADRQPSAIQVALLTLLVALALIGLVIFFLATFTSMLG